jgi:hypothetical protein
MPTPTIKDYVAGWTEWGLPVIANGLAPWLTQVTSMTLISNAFQPEANIGASLIGVVASFAMFGLTLRRSKAANSKLILPLLATFLGALLTCVGVKLNLGVSWNPAPELQPLVWVAWHAVYWTTFGALGATLTAISVVLVHRTRATAETSD